MQHCGWLTFTLDSHVLLHDDHKLNLKKTTSYTAKLPALVTSKLASYQLVRSYQLVTNAGKTAGKLTASN